MEIAILLDILELKPFQINMRIDKGNKTAICEDLLEPIVIS